MCLVAGREKMFTWKLSKGLVSLCDLWRSGSRSEQQEGFEGALCLIPGLPRSVSWILFPLLSLLSQCTPSLRGAFYRARSTVEAP